MLFGIETEYGIAVEGKGASEMMAEARAVVRAYRGKYASPWNYGAESPRRDMRGFEVEHLTQDEMDRQFDRDSAHFASQSDERSDRVLPNGARLYNDHGHPEYATPECRSLLDLVAHDRAGERILLECARQRSEDGPQVSLFKNNTDFHGASYGCHESYLLPRSIPFEDLRRSLIPFLVTRQVYAGAGKVGTEPAIRSDTVFQLSQRADFFTEEASVDTLARRPIFNTRDEPHADPRHYRRLHVIVGDANMNEFSTALKVGATAAVLRLIQTGWRPEIQLLHPVKAVKAISRDPQRRWNVELEGHRVMGAVDIQRIYCEEALTVLEDAPEDIRWAMQEWLHVLDALETDPMSLGDRLDWVAKFQLLDAFRAEEGLDWDDHTLQSLDLAYADVDPQEGLFHGLEQDGHAVRLVDDAAVERAMRCPPEDTRAAVRGALVDRFASGIHSVAWGGLCLGDNGSRSILDLGVLDAEKSRRIASLVRTAETLDQALQSMQTEE